MAPYRFGLALVPLLNFLLGVVPLFSVSVLGAAIAPREPQRPADPRPGTPGSPALKLSVSIPDNIAPVLNQNFADPSVIDGRDGKWYGYSTNNRGVHVPVSTADSLAGPWSPPGTDAMPDLGWTSGTNTWAPDIQYINGEFVLYFAGQRAGTTSGHCLGVARAHVPTGPFVMAPEPFLCRDEVGGVIDVSGFVDPQTGRRHVIYKLEGSLTVGGQTYTTPFVLREVGWDGTTLVGPETILMGAIEAEDGPLIEAPQLVYRNSHYILFFSSHFFTDVEYDVKYAVSAKLEGPYVRGETLIDRSMGNLDGPGGAQSVLDQNVLLFHGWCLERRSRCLYYAEYTIEATEY